MRQHQRLRPRGIVWNIPSTHFAADVEQVDVELPRVPAAALADATGGALDRLDLLQELLGRHVKPGASDGINVIGLTYRPDRMRHIEA